MCSIAKCGKPIYNKRLAFCEMHYYRVRRHGDPYVTRRRADGDGTIDSHGYRVRMLRSHPLAPASGLVKEHRAVLFDAIGPGAHRCHWCGTTVAWERSWPRHADALVVDHLDHDRLNNDPANLVASCGACNGERNVPTTSAPPKEEVPSS